MDEPCKRSLKFKMLRKAQHDKYLDTCICYSDLERIYIRKLSSRFS